MIRTLEWPNGPPATGKVQQVCRHQRYQALFDVCHERNIRALLLGHNQTDQIGELYVCTVKDEALIFKYI